MTGTPDPKGWIEVGSVADLTDPTKQPKWIAALGPFLTANGSTDVSYFSMGGPKGDWQLDQVVHRASTSRPARWARSPRRPQLRCRQPRGGS